MRQFARTKDMNVKTMPQRTKETIQLDIDQDSRTYRLRQMYWDKTHEEGIVSKKVIGCGEDTLVGHARDFATLLDASAPFIQAKELIIGCCLAIPEDRTLIDLGFYDPHYPPGHAILLQKGLTGIRDEAKSRLETETDQKKREFLQAVEISYNAALSYVEKNAAHAEEMAAAEPNPLRREELDRIARVCHELATEPPSSFHAALQLVQFTRVFGGYGCIGRFDQWLYPFYKAEIERGEITREDAQELLECFFVKLNHFADVNEVAHRTYLSVDNDSLRNISLAGQTPDGVDACNELTYACLEASAKLMLPEPKLNVRFFDGSPPELVRECCRVLAKGANVLAIFNDEVVIPAVSRLGIPIEDARDYCNDGCSEIIMGGKGTIHFKVHNALPLLNDMVLQANDSSYETFEDVMADYKARLTQLMPEDHGERLATTNPYFAAGIEDCLAEASPAAARYDINGSILAQVGNAADGLAAIKKFIFEDDAFGWTDLIDAMKSNFDKHEQMLQMLRNRGPKYGNDIDYVDEIVKEIAEYFCDGIHERADNPAGPGPKRAAGFMSFGIHRKSDFPASPDGRRQGDPTANSFSPSVGMDRSGPTAVLSSLAKIDLTKASHGSVLDLALHSSIVQGTDALEKFAAMVTASLKMKSVATLQLNIIDRETLLKARANPNAPEFKTLIVRVWGFSAVFVELPTELQDHVISRTEHGAIAS
jgi:pyruvate-formate lyase